MERDNDGRDPLVPPRRSTLGELLEWHKHLGDLRGFLFDIRWYDNHPPAPEPERGKKARSVDRDR
jgi:hypothetical protein